MSAIRIDALSASYRGEVAALSALDLEVGDGAIHGLLGPNGAGKTTALRVMLGMLPATSGTIRVLGLDPGAHPLEVRSRCGVLFEADGLFPRLNALENLRFYASAYGLEGPQSVEAVDEALERLPFGARRDAIGSWSRGMRRQLALSRTLLHQPELLLLDEPTAGLDADAADAVVEMLRRFSRTGVSVLLITHEHHIAEQICDAFTIMIDGTSRESGSLDALRSSKSLGAERVVVRGDFPASALTRVESLPTVVAASQSAGELVVRLRQGAALTELMTTLSEGGSTIADVAREVESLGTLYRRITRASEDGDR